MGVMRDDLPAEFLLDQFPLAIRDTGRALRSLILASVPGTVETVRPGWRWIAYSLPEKGRVRNYAWIGPERKHIHLGFEHGTLLADPDLILHGAEERLRKFRYFTFEPAIDIDEAVLVDYIRRAADLAVLPPRQRRAIEEAGFEPIEGAEIPADIEVTQFEPNRVLAFRTVEGPVRPEGRYELAEEGGATRFTFSLNAELKGMKKLMSPMVQKQMNAEVGNLENLKRILET